MRFFQATALVALGLTAVYAQENVNAPAAVTSPAGSGGLRRGPQTPKGPTPRLADGHPDFSGVWNGGGPVGDLSQGLAKGGEDSSAPRS